MKIFAIQLIVSVALLLTAHYTTLAPVTVEQAPIIIDEPQLYMVQVEKEDSNGFVYQSTILKVDRYEDTVTEHFESAGYTVKAIDAMGETYTTHHNLVGVENEQQKMFSVAATKTMKNGKTYMNYIMMIATYEDEVAKYLEDMDYTIENIEVVDGPTIIEQVVIE